jgi:hypothetical protein
MYDIVGLEESCSHRGLKMIASSTEMFSAYFATLLIVNFPSGKPTTQHLNVVAQLVTFKYRDLLRNAKCQVGVVTKGWGGWPSW